MDLVLNVLDQQLLTPYVYPATWPENDWLRQFFSLLLVVNVGGVIMYFSLASFSFLVVFDRTLMQHPLILENQIRKEIMVTLKSVPFMSFPTVLLFLLEVRGYSRLYLPTNFTWPLFVGDILFSTLCFLIFTDALIYWIHRGLHHRSVYKHLHKVHHRWKVPTPFASHAFHPLDGFLQSLPYHLYPFIFPLNKYVYLGLFVFVNIWTVSIHDGDYRVPELLRPVINGSAHHTDHHLLYNYNYGQYFTLWDRIGGSFREPNAFQGKTLFDDLKKNGGKME
ncbi:lathosterol oxidase-like [Oculina patagonica]